MAAFGDNTRTIHDSERWETWENVTIRSLTNLEYRKILFEIEKGKKNKGFDGLKLTDGSKEIEMLLGRCIVKWTFTVDGIEDGDIADVTPEYFDNLPKNYSDFIEREIRDFTPDRDEFLGASGDGGGNGKG